MELHLKGISSQAKKLAQSERNLPGSQFGFNLRTEVLRDVMLSNFQNYPSRHVQTKILS